MGYLLPGVGIMGVLHGHVAIPVVQLRGLVMGEVIGGWCEMRVQASSARVLLVFEGSGRLRLGRYAFGQIY